jgi:hypothetical protein
MDPPRPCAGIGSGREAGKERNGKKQKKRKGKIVGPTVGRVGWRPSKNGGWEGGFGGVCKMETCLEVVLEMCFFVNPPFWSRGPYGGPH